MRKILPPETSSLFVDWFDAFSSSRAEGLTVGGGDRDEGGGVGGAEGGETAAVTGDGAEGGETAAVTFASLVAADSTAMPRAAEASSGEASDSRR